MLALTGITSCQANSKTINSDISFSNYNVLFSTLEGLLPRTRPLGYVCPKGQSPHSAVCQPPPGFSEDGPSAVPAWPVPSH